MSLTKVINRRKYIIATHKVKSRRFLPESVRIQPNKRIMGIKDIKRKCLHWRWKRDRYKTMKKAVEEVVTQDNTRNTPRGYRVNISHNMKLNQRNLPQGVNTTERRHCSKKIESRRFESPCAEWRKNIKFNIRIPILETEAILNTGML